MHIGIDVHKDSSFVAAQDEREKIREQKEAKPDQLEAWIHSLDRESKLQWKQAPSATRSTNRSSSVPSKQEKHTQAS
jgi:hypothetical protein